MTAKPAGNFIARTLTGAAFAAVLLGSVYLHAWSFTALIVVIAMLSLKEFYDLTEQKIIIVF